MPDMYGKNLIFKTGGVDGCDCAEILHLIEEGKIDTTPLITHRFKLADIEEAYRIFENRLDGVIKIAITDFCKACSKRGDFMIKHVTTTPAKALEKLKAGNARYIDAMVNS